MSSKQFVQQCFETNPILYGKDGGELHLINAYLNHLDLDTISLEQHKAIATILRKRNSFLADNPNYDLRKRNQPQQYLQLSLFDYLDNDTAKQTAKLTQYFTNDTNRLNQSSSRIKKSVRGVDDDHIIATKLMLPLFIANPKLKKKPIKWRQHKAPSDRRLSSILSDDLETVFTKEKVGE